MTRAQLKQLARLVIKVVAGGPTDVTRGKELIRLFDAVIDNAALATELPGGPTEFFQIIPENEYGTHPRLDSQLAVNAYLLSIVSNGLFTTQPPAPTGAQVDDVGNTFSHLVVPGFTTPSDYELATGGAYSVRGNAYIQSGRVIFPGLTAAYAVGEVSSRVVASGARPAGQSVSNATAFTGSAPSNQNPTVSLTLSSNAMTLGQPLIAYITAADSDGTLKALELYQTVSGGTSKVGQLLNPTGGPNFTITYTPLAGASARTLQVKAIDDKDGYTLSNVQNLTVTDPNSVVTDLQILPNLRQISGKAPAGATAADYALEVSYSAQPLALPTVTLDGPGVTTPNTPTTYTGTVTKDPSVTISKVEIEVDGAISSIDTTAPYEFSFNTSVTGNHTLRLKVTDSAGQSAFSAPMTVSVAVAGDGYAPPTDGSVLAFMEADNAAGITLFSGDPAQGMASMASKYGAGATFRKYSAATAGPVVVADSFGSKPGVLFGASTLTIPALPAVGNFFFLAVCKFAADEAFEAHIFNTRLNGADPDIVGARKGGTALLAFGGSAYQGVAPAANVPFLVLVRRSGSFGGMHILTNPSTINYANIQTFYDNPQAYNTGVSTATFTSLVLASSSEGTAGFRGAMGAATLWTRDPTSTELQNLVTHLNPYFA